MTEVQELLDISNKLKETDGQTKEFFILISEKQGLNKAIKSTNSDSVELISLQKKLIRINQLIDSFRDFHKMRAELSQRYNILKQQVALHSTIGNNSLYGDSKFYATIKRKGKFFEDVGRGEQSISINWYVDLSLRVDGSQSKLANYTTIENLDNKPGMIVEVSLWISDKEEGLYMSGFHALLGMRPEIDAILTAKDREFLKGLAYSSLCYVLKLFDLPPSTSFSLTASGKSGELDMKGLISYYERIGFIPDSEYKGDAINMHSTIGTVAAKCPTQIKQREEIISALIR